MDEYTHRIFLVLLVQKAISQYSQWWKTCPIHSSQIKLCKKLCTMNDTHAHTIYRIQFRRRLWSRISSCDWYIASTDLHSLDYCCVSWFVTNSLFFFCIHNNRKFVNDKLFLWSSNRELIVALLLDACIRASGSVCLFIYLLSHTIQVGCFRFAFIKKNSLSLKSTDKFTLCFSRWFHCRNKKRISGKLYKSRRNDDTICEKHSIFFFWFFFSSLELHSRNMNVELIGKRSIVIQLVNCVKIKFLF